MSFLLEDQFPTKIQFFFKKLFSLSKAKFQLILWAKVNAIMKLKRLQKMKQI